jgi:hypothetical protein
VLQLGVAAAYSDGDSSYVQLCVYVARLGPKSGQKVHSAHAEILHVLLSRVLRPPGQFLGGLCENDEHGSATAANPN